MFVSLSTFLIIIYIISIIFNVIVLGACGCYNEIEDFGDVFMVIGLSIVPVITLIIFVLTLYFTLNLDD
jgi:hypothetical protein